MLQDLKKKKSLLLYCLILFTASCPSIILCLILHTNCALHFFYCWQKKAADKVNHITQEAIKEMFLESKPMSLCIADLGCSSGPNSLSNIKELVNAIERESRKLFERAPEFRVYLNDLPTNDFNTIFQALPDLYRELKKGRNHGSPSIYIAGYPGTFYGRLFPDKCLHFIYSSNSLHWLSRVSLSYLVLSTPLFSE